TGQRCTATSRVVATGGIYDTLVERLGKRAAALKVGNGLEPGIQMGPAVDANQLATALAAIERAKADGARLVTGGKRLQDGALARGQFVEPTVFADVNPTSNLGQEEVFGPVLAISKAKDFDDALRIANDVRYGLANSVYTRDANTVMR